MTREELVTRFRAEATKAVPFPGSGKTAQRLRALADLGREDLSLARLVEAHWDAVAILAEADRVPVPGALYGVWAAQSPQSPLTLNQVFKLNGSKAFASGAGLVDRALVTAQDRLIDLDLITNSANIAFDSSSWQTSAFADTNTATAVFNNCLVDADDLMGVPCWYLDRPGFWSGALAPAACWAGGAMGLIDYATRQGRSDSHTMAHLGALYAWQWALHAYLENAGNAIDADPHNASRNRMVARTVRHLIEQACSDTLTRLGRAYGPHPLAMDAEIGRRYQELTLYIRQCHAERDLEQLGRDVHNK